MPQYRHYENSVATTSAAVEDFTFKNSVFDKSFSLVLISASISVLKITSA